MSHKPFTICLLAALLAWAAATPAEARRDDRQDDRREEQRQERRHDRAERAPRRDGLSLDEAVARVRRDTGGRVLAAETRDGQHRIKVLLPDGAVRVIHVDAGRGGRN